MSAETFAAELPGPEMMDPERYARDGYPHDTWTRLRRESPVHRYEDFDYPFWILSRRAEIVEVSRQPDRFTNHPRFQIVVGSDFASEDEREPETIIHMDPPRHRLYRDLLSRRFTPRALAPLESHVEEIMRDLIDDLAASGGTGDEGVCDFVDKIAVPLPMAVIASLLEVPRADWTQLFHWTNAVVAPAEPAYRLGEETAHETRLRASNELYNYFAALALERQGGTGDDLVTVLANAEVGGERLSHHELVSYYLLLVAAGNETTRNAISGGLLAFLGAKDQWRSLQAEPMKARRASEEVLRWTTPVVQMARTAAMDTEIAGQKISKGDTLALFYASANRDERVFEDPFSFRIDRHPNPHLSLGIGEHFCMGAHLARLEIRVVFKMLAAHFADMELAGPAERLASCNVGGLKSLPIRYRLNGH